MRFIFTSKELEYIESRVEQLRSLVNADPADPKIDFDKLYRYVVDIIEADGVADQLSKWVHKIFLMSA